MPKLLKVMAMPLHMALNMDTLWVDAAAAVPQAVQCTMVCRATCELSGWLETNTLQH